MNYLEKQELKKAENLLNYHKRRPELSQRKLALMFHWDLKKVNKILRNEKSNLQKSS